MQNSLDIAKSLQYNFLKCEITYPALGYLKKYRSQYQESMNLTHGKFH